MDFSKQVGAIGAMALGTCFALQPALADVTISQQTTFDAASFVKSHGSTTTVYTLDKERRDSETHCEGMLSIVCGNMQSGEIVRLDRGVTWHLEPKKKRYLEQVFATPEQIAAMRDQMNATLEKMRSCPAAQKQEVDKSKCQMSPPKFDVRKTGDKGLFAGHNAERTQATITESCTNKDTGDVCDTVVAIDVWLTQDSLAGTADRRAFDLAYAKKLGLDDPQGLFTGQMAQYLARYQSQIAELSEKAKQFKGAPLKTSFRVLAGGAQCSSAKSNSQAGGDSSSSPNPVANVTDAGKAVGKFVGGLFKKKSTDDPQAASTAAPAPAAATPPTPSEFPQMTQLVAFTIETTAISTEAVAPTVFDIPADWIKEVPPPAKAGKDDFTCPKNGG
jgi:hypothetical protein